MGLVENWGFTWDIIPRRLLST
jgi:hypothetical protein